MYEPTNEQNVKMALFYMEEDKKRFEKSLRGRAITSWYIKLLS